MNGILSIFLVAAAAAAVNGEGQWWETMSLYQIYPKSFKDSDGDGVGDLKGIYDNLEHLVDARINGLWLSPIYPSPGVDAGYDITDFKGVDAEYGTLEDFDKLVEKAHRLGLKVMMDFVPNHTSDQHEWFQKSIDNIPPYNDYYIWRNGTLRDDGTMAPPNNWVSCFRGPAWTWNDKRQAFYYHQFTRQQPDLNFRNKNLGDEMKNVLRFWLEMGVDGFRVDAIPQVFEIETLDDEPRSNTTDDPEDYAYLSHIYTRDQPEVYELISEWRNLVDEYKQDGQDRVLLMEAYSNRKFTMQYYDTAHFPFNFWFIERLNGDSSAEEVRSIIDEWMTHMPEGKVANWVAGNHDKRRIASRYGATLAQGMKTLVLLLPGVAVTYYGDEIGMPDNHVSWEDTKDPWACNAGIDKFEAVTRDPARTPFLWDKTASSGFSTNTKTWLPVNPNYKTLNLESQKQEVNSEFKFYQAVADLRKWPAARKGGLKTYVLQDKILVISRTLENERSIYVAVNFDHSRRTVDFAQEIEGFPEKIVIYRTSSHSGLRSGDKVEPRSAQIPARGVVIYVTPEEL